MAGAPLKGPLDPFPNLLAGWPKGKPRRHAGGRAVILGADPAAPVHRAPGPMPWRSGPSKLRCPHTGLLLPLPRSALA